MAYGFMGVDTAYARLAREGIGLALYSHFKSMVCGYLPNIIFGKVRMRSIQVLCFHKDELWSRTSLIFSANQQIQIGI